MRFYDVNSGKITVDGVDIRDMKRGALRRLFGMVLQDTWLFNGTIRDNIAYGRPGASEDEIVQAATAAHADHFIRTLPEGYDTILNEEASNISQGQRQLLTIARASGRSGRSHPRRSDQQRRFAHRGLDPAGDGHADAGTDELRHRPQAIDDS